MRDVPAVSGTAQTLFVLLNENQKSLQRCSKQNVTGLWTSCMRSLTRGQGFTRENAVADNGWMDGWKETREHTPGVPA